MAKILLVEDERRIRQLLEVYLTSAGHGLVTASNISAGIEALSRSPFDILILDVRLKEEDGADLLGFVRNNGIRVKVIVMSGFNDTGTVQTFKKLGTDYFLAKPFDLDELNMAIRELELLNNDMI